MSSRLANPSRSLTASLMAAIAALRPHYWTKNTLVFLPLLAAHRAAEPALLRAVAQATVALCCVASLGYLVNDYWDRADDRRHPLKTERRALDDRVTRTLLALIVLMLVIVAHLCLSPLPRSLSVVLGGYLLVSLLYSWRLKQWIWVDVVVLVLLFELRLWVGALAVAIPLSPWLLVFSLWFFLSLALLKRVAALTALSALGCDHEPGRPYQVSHLPLLRRLGRPAGLAALLVAAAYLASSKAAALYTRPWLLAPVLVLLALWLLRLWRLADAGTIRLDPVQFALRDQLSYGLLVLIGGFWWLAR